MRVRSLYSNCRSEHETRHRRVHREKFEKREVCVGVVTEAQIRNYCERTCIHTRDLQPMTSENHRYNRILKVITPSTIRWLLLVPQKRTVQ